MPVFEYSSTYPHPRADVFAWHTRPGGFVRLSPPMTAEITSPPSNGIRVGSELSVRISDPLIAALLPNVTIPGRGHGPVGLPWVARHVEYVEGDRFVDVQVSGPLRSWRHEHLFADAPGGGTTITDRVTWESPVLLGAATGLASARIETLFRYREQQLRDDLALHARLRARPIHVVVTGASGLIGRQLCAVLTTGGHRVTRLVRRRPETADEAFWDPVAGVLDPAVLRGADAVAHLAGATIAGRFTARHKDAILRSRLDSSSTLARALASHGMPRTLVQASAIGIYGAKRPGEVLTEDSPPGTGFLADVVRQWEAAARPARKAGVRTVLMRTGIVLSGGGGALLSQLPMFLAGAGGRLTSPTAYGSWIGLDDMARAYVHALLTPTLEGPVNVVAPNPATASEFARVLGGVLNRPALVPTPSLGTALVLGREGASEIIDTDQRVSSDKLQASGFVFGQPRLAGALTHVLLK